jgi:hypothetical protein
MHFEGRRNDKVASNLFGLIALLAKTASFLEYIAVRVKLYSLFTRQPRFRGRLFSTYP